MSIFPERPAQMYPASSRHVFVIEAGVTAIILALMLIIFAALLPKTPIVAAISVDTVEERQIENHLSQNHAPIAVSILVK